MARGSVSSLETRLADAPAGHEFLPLRGLRIVVLLHSLDLGGAERQAIQLARYLSHEQRAEVEVWALTGAGRASALCEAYDLPWRTLRPPPTANTRPGRSAASPGARPAVTSEPRAPGHYRLPVRLAWTLAQTLRRHRPAAILSYTLFPNVLAGLVWRLSGARCCIWNQRGVARSATIPLAERVAARLASRRVVNAEHLRLDMGRHFAVPLTNIVVIRNGVELPAPQCDGQAWRQALAIAPECFVACMAASLSATKDHATLLAAWRLVIDRFEQAGESAVLILAGRHEPRAAAITAQAQALGLAGSVLMPGHIDDMAGLWQAVDLAVFSSRAEGCPNGVLEAMAAGLAVVGTNVAGVREAVGSEGEAWLAEPGDAAGLAKHVWTLARDARQRCQLGRLNQVRIASLFSPEVLGRRMTSLLAEALIGQG